MVGSQISNLTFDLSFGHNLCFKYSNETCKPILDIYILESFKWYNELFSRMNFEPTITLWKFKSQLGFQLPKWEPTLGVCGFIPSHPPTFMGAWNVTLELHPWPAPLKALTLDEKPRLRLQHCFTMVNRPNIWYSNFSNNQIVLMFCYQSQT